jgi:hypothetical protein
VHLKWFLSLCYVWHKPFTYLAPTLTLSLNGPIRDSRWPTSPKSPIHYVQNGFQGHGMFGPNQAPILHLALSPNGPKWASTWPRNLGVPSGASKMIYVPMLHLAQAMQLSCTTLTLSSNGPKQYSTWPMSPRSSIDCIQKQCLSLWYIWPKSCTYVASRLALSPNGLNRASTWVSSPRSTIGCVQNDFWGYLCLA